MQAKMIDTHTSIPITIPSAVPPEALLRELGAAHRRGRGRTAVGEGFQEFQAGALQHALHFATPKNR